MIPTVHQLARFEQAKEQFKQQMCFNVDMLFNTFVSELNTSQQLTASSNSILTNDAAALSLNSDTVAFQRSFNSVVVQKQQCLNANESLTCIDELVRAQSVEDRQQKEPVNEREPKVNLNQEMETSNENDMCNLFSSDQTQQRGQNVIQSTDSQNNLIIKQEITDEDEGLNKAQYSNNINYDVNWEKAAQANRLIDVTITPEYVPACQYDSCKSGMINQEEANLDSTKEQNDHVDNHQPHHSSDQYTTDNAFAPDNSSYMDDDDDEIYDEELLREVKEEILEEQRINTKKPKIDSSQCAKIVALQVAISTENPLADGVDRIINSNSSCTSTQPIFPSQILTVTSSTSNVSPVQSNYKQNEIIRFKTEQNIERNALEDGELIDSDEDKHFISSAQKDPVPGKSNFQSSWSKLVCPKYDYDKFRVIRHDCPSCCNLSFTDKEGFTAHMFQVHKLLPFQCPFPGCSLSKCSFSTISQLKEHFQNKNPSHSQTNCIKCAKKCDNPMALFIHTIDHHYPGMFACVKENCRHEARFRALAINHYNLEHLENDTRKLAKMSKREANMGKEDVSDNLHKTQFTVISVKCTVKECQYEFSTTIELEHHLKIEHGILDYACHIESCGMSFTLRSELICHSEVVHRDIKRFFCLECTYCSYNFMGLIRHNFLNHHEGKFKCGNDKCGYVGKFRIETTKHYTRKHVSSKHPHNYNQL